MRWFISLFLLIPGWGITEPVDSHTDPCRPLPQNHLFYDLARFLSPDDRSQLEYTLRHYYTDSHFQVVIILTDTLCGTDIAMYANEVGQRWGVGVKGLDNGAVIVMVPRRGNRKGQIFIAPGRGIQDRLPDALVKRIIEEITLPYFRDGHFVKGLQETVSAMSRAVGGQPPFPVKQEYLFRIKIFLAIIGVFLLFMGFSAAARWAAARQIPNEVDLSYVRTSFIGALFLASGFSIAILWKIGFRYAIAYALAYFGAIVWGTRLGRRYPHRYKPKEPADGGAKNTFNTFAPWVISGRGSHTNHDFGGDISFGGGSFNGGGAGGSW